MGLWVSFAMQKSCAAYDGCGPFPDSCAAAKTRRHSITSSEAYVASSNICVTRSGTSTIA
jgi:hypothetical protein